MFKFGTALSLVAHVSLAQNWGYPAGGYGAYGGYSGYGGYTAPASYGSKSQAPSYNPWSPNSNKAPVDKTGWYSQWQQYSPNKSVYVAAWTEKPVYAICDTGVFKLQFAQFPGKTVTARLNTDNSLIADKTYRFRITEYTNDQETCANGNEYRPLQEYDKRHKPNQYQDPKRGRIADVKTGATQTQFVD